MMFLFLSIDRFFPFSMCTQSNPLVYGFHWKIKKEQISCAAVWSDTSRNKNHFRFVNEVEYYQYSVGQKKYLVIIVNSVSSLHYIIFLFSFCWEKTTKTHQLVCHTHTQTWHIKRDIYWLYMILYYK